MDLLDKRDVKSVKVVKFKDIIYMRSVDSSKEKCAMLLGMDRIASELCNKG